MYTPWLKLTSSFEMKPIYVSKIGITCISPNPRGKGSIICHDGNTMGFEVLESPEEVIDLINKEQDTESQ